MSPVVEAYLPAVAGLLIACALQASAVAALLLIAERALRRASLALRTGLVAIALAKFATPAWVAWPLWSAPAGTDPAAVPAAGAGMKWLFGGAPGAASAAPITGVAGLAIIWALGVLVVLLRWIVARARLARALAAAEPCRDRRALAALSAASGRAGLHPPPALCRSTTAATPFATGWWTPRIVLPAAWIDRLSSADLETILLHEAIHVRCGDVVKLELATLLDALWWWNPVCRSATARWRGLIEDGCDDRVLELRAGDAPAYCGVLLRSARLAVGVPVADPAGAAGIGLHDVERRLRRLMECGFTPTHRLHASSAALLLVAGVLLLPFVGPAPVPASARIHRGPESIATRAPGPTARRRHAHGRHAHGGGVHVHVIPLGP